jgi:hypothetical protein
MCVWRLSNSCDLDKDHAASPSSYTHSTKLHCLKCIISSTNRITGLLVHQIHISCTSFSTAIQGNLNPNAMHQRLVPWLSPTIPYPLHRKTNWKDLATVSIISHLVGLHRQISNTWFRLADFSNAVFPDMFHGAKGAPTRYHCPAFDLNNFGSLAGIFSGHRTLLHGSFSAWCSSDLARDLLCSFMSDWLILSLSRSRRGVRSA